MCRLLGYAAPARVTVQDALGPGQSAVFQDMARLHRDGWGSAWLSRDRTSIGVERSSQPDDDASNDGSVATSGVDASGVATSRVDASGVAASRAAADEAADSARADGTASDVRAPEPASWLDILRSPATGLDDPDLTRTLVDDVSAARIVHLRMATGGMECAPENTHPFVADGMAFAHNGAVTPVALVEQHVAPDILASLSGITDSERYFAVIRSRVADGMSVVDAVRWTVTTLRRDFPDASLNAVLLTPTHLVAVHASESSRVPHGDFDASGLSDDELPIDHREGYYLMRWRRLADRTVIFASSGLDISGWEALPAESVATVDLRTLELEIHAIAGADVRKVA